MNPLQPGPQTLEALMEEEDRAVSDLLNACDDYCGAIATGQSELAEDAQRARSRARVRLNTIHERLKRAVLERA